MQARNTQGLAGIGMVQTKTLVNRTRMKVVNIALTKAMKNFSINTGPHPESCALAQRLEGWPQTLVAHPSRRGQGRSSG
jgi:hypothetical protein